MSGRWFAVAACLAVAVAAKGQAHRPRNLQPPRVIYQPAPTYPRLAILARIEGIVKLGAWIGEEGTVESLELISGHPFLVKAAMDAVKKWRYLPMTWDGKPVASSMLVEVPFRLERPLLPEGRASEELLVARVSCWGGSRCF